MENLKIIRGDDVTLNTTFTDEDGDVVDISSANLIFTIKEEVDSTAVLSKTVASGLHTSPALGITEINLTHTETNIDAGDYYYDIQLTFGNGNVNSVEYGKIIVIPDITI